MVNVLVKLALQSKLILYELLVFVSYALTYCCYDELDFCEHIRQMDREEQMINDEQCFSTRNYT